jgi:hypothetical protein
MTRVGWHMNVTSVRARGRDSESLCRVVAHERACSEALIKTMRRNCQPRLWHVRAHGRCGESTIIRSQLDDVTLHQILVGVRAWQASRGEPIQEGPPSKLAASLSKAEQLIFVASRDAFAPTAGSQQSFWGRQDCQPLPPMNRSSNGELLFNDNDEKYVPHSTFAQTPKVRRWVLGRRATQPCRRPNMSPVPWTTPRVRIHKQQQWRMNSGVGASTAVFSRTTRVASVAVRLANARLRGHTIHKQSNHDHRSSETRARHPEHGALFKQSFGGQVKINKEKESRNDFFS